MVNPVVLPAEAQLCHCLLKPCFPMSLWTVFCVSEFRKLLLSLGLEKKKGVRDILEIIALVENSWRAVCVDFVFVFVFFFF